MAAGPSIVGYADIRHIGRGGLGDVYRARQVVTGREVAIKILRDVSDSSVAWHRTRRELNALLALSGHANVIQIVELLELDEGPALVMEFAPGGSVADLLAEGGGILDVDQTVFVGRQTAAALVAAHVRGIVHRDIKPQNLLIDEGGQVKLCDFGIAALTRDDEYRNRTNAISMRYASPEDLESDVEVGPPSDVYSLGATLLHLLHGAPPTLKERLAPWEPPFVDDPRVAALDRVIARCLQPTPAVRPTAQALLDSLEGLAVGAGPDRVSALPVVHRALPRVPAEPTAPPEAAEAADVTPQAVPTDDLAGLLDVDAGADAHAGHRLPSPAEAVRRPDPRPGRARRVSLVAGTALAAFLMVLVLWPADDADAPTATTAASAGPVPTAVVTSTIPTPTASIGAVPLNTLPRPEGLPPLEQADWDVGDLGDCLVQVDGEEALAVVHCGDPHDLQRAGSGSLDDLERLDGHDTFDQDAIRAAVTDVCAQEFVRFVRSVVVSSELGLVTTQPSADTWADGDRDFACFVGKRDYRIVGDAENSGW